MLKTLLCIQHLFLVGFLSRRGWASAPIEYFSPTADGDETHVHFYMPRAEARILFGELPLPIRNKIRSLQTVSFQDEVDAEADRIEDAKQYVIDCAEAEHDERHEDACINPDLRRKLGWDVSIGMTAYYYYDDSPSYNTALIFGIDCHPDEVKEIAEDYRSEMRDEIESCGSIYSACEIRQIKTNKEWQRLYEEAENHININE
jgi:hypothetical protein